MLLIRWKPVTPPKNAEGKSSEDIESSTNCFNDNYRLRLRFLGEKEKQGRSRIHRGEDQDYAGVQVLR